MPEALPKYRLKKDLYVVRPDRFDPYTYVTKEELDEGVHLEHEAGGIYEYDPEQHTLSHPDRATFGVDDEGPDPALWEPYDPATPAIQVLRILPLDSEGGHCD
jgi:hypothetical protein